jgi:uncharacterized protein YndB with AHSA1/START domain
MSSVIESVEIARSPDDVFRYIAEPTRRPEWQDAVETVKVERLTPEGVGTRVRESRRVQGTTRSFTWEVTAYEPGRHYSLRGIDGPVRAHVDLRLTPLDDGRRTRVDIEIDFKGSGVGKAFVVLARRGARKEAPVDGEHLKQRLESAPTST